MEKRYKRLRERMKAQGLTGSYLQLRIGYAQKSNFLSDRLTGKYQFDLKTAYDIMEVLHIPPEEFALYFPRDGIAQTVKAPAASAKPAETRRRITLEVVEGDISMLIGGFANG